MSEVRCVTMYDVRQFGSLDSIRGLKCLTAFLIFRVQVSESGPKFILSYIVHLTSYINRDNNLGRLSGVG